MNAWASKTALYLYENVFVANKLPVWFKEFCVVGGWGSKLISLEIDVIMATLGNVYERLLYKSHLYPSLKKKKILLPSPSTTQSANFTFKNTFCLPRTPSSVIFPSLVQSDSFIFQDTFWLSPSIVQSASLNI